MSIIQSSLEAVQQTGLAAWVRENDYSFPLIECVHVASVMLVFGSICMMDLRLLGVAHRSVRATALSERTLPWTWLSFAVAVISGCILMSGQARGYVVNPQFQMKMALLAAAGVNMAVFHFAVWRGVAAWDGARTPPLAARLAGGLSLALWTAVIVAGRWVGWTFGA